MGYHTKPSWSCRNAGYGLAFFTAAFGFMASAQPASAVCPANATELAAFVEACSESDSCGSFAETCNEEFTIELKSITTEGYIVTYEYEVCRVGGAAALSHVVFGIDCPLSAALPCDGCSTVTPDPTTGLSGFKFDITNAETCTTVELKIDKSLLPDGIGVGTGCITVATKAGNQVLGGANTPGYACVDGPICGEQFNESVTCAIEGDEAVCESDLALEYTVTTNAVNPSFAWEVTDGNATITNGADTDTVTVDAADENFTLSVTVSDPVLDPSTCTIDVTVNAVPEVTIVAADTTLNCATESIEVCAETDVEGATYAWTKDGDPIEGADSACIEVTEEGEYCVTVTSAGDCATSACITIDEDFTEPELTVIVEPAQLDCDNAEATITASSTSDNVTFAWTGPNGAIEVDDPSANPNVIVVSGPGTYTVVATDGDNSCVSEDSVEVLGFEPVDADASVEADITCDTPVVEICASYTPTTATVTFSWTGPNDFTADTQCIEVDEPGDYCVTVFDVNTACSDTVCVTVNEILPPSCEIAAPEVAPDCGSEGNTLSATTENGEGTITYSWSVTGDGWLITDGADSDTITYTAGEPGTTGVFTLVVTDELGCESECTLEVSCLSGELFCSYTQGFWGNKNGLALMLELLDGTDLVVGLPGRSLTVTHAGAQCLNSALPMGGKAAPLAVGDVVWNDLSCVFGRRDRGSFGNVLVGQTIALSLNVLNDPELCDLALCNVITTQAAILEGEDYVLDPGEDGILFTEDDPIEIHTIPQEVLDALDALGLPQTVCGLLELANRAVGGDTDLGGASLSQINDAATAINEGFDECRILLICAPAEEETE